MPSVLALGMPALVAEGAPEDPVSARTATNAIRVDNRPATWPQIIEDRAEIAAFDSPDGQEDRVVAVSPDLRHLQEAGRDQPRAVKIDVQRPPVVNRASRSGR